MDRHTGRSRSLTGGGEAGCGVFGDCAGGRFARVGPASRADGRGEGVEGRKHESPPPAGRQGSARDRPAPPSARRTSARVRHSGQALKSGALGRRRRAARPSSSSSAGISPSSMGGPAPVLRIITSANSLPEGSTSESGFGSIARNPCGSASPDAARAARASPLGRRSCGAEGPTSRSTPRVERTTPGTAARPDGAVDCPAPSALAWAAPPEAAPRPRSPVTARRRPGASIT